MTARARSFGSVASAYEEYRPGYPDEVVDHVLAYAGQPISTALEIGAGTGKATRVFARRGIAITASDPDAAMLAELRKHVPASVTTVQAALEELPLTSTYDLVYAAASLHWTESTGRWSRVAALLRPGATFASFGGEMCLSEPALEAAVTQARMPFLADDSAPPPEGRPTDSAMNWPGNALQECGLFTDVREVIIERRSRMPAERYVGLLSTVSAYLELSAAVRGEALAAIRDVLPESVLVTADVVLHLGRRRP